MTGTFGLQSPEEPKNLYYFFQSLVSIFCPLLRAPYVTNMPYYCTVQYIQHKLTEARKGNSNPVTPPHPLPPHPHLLTSHPIVLSLHMYLISLTELFGICGW